MLKASFTLARVRMGEFKMLSKPGLKWITALGFVGLFGAMNAQAVLLTLEPSNQAAATGDTGVEVELWVRDVLAIEGIGTFEVNVGYDAAAVTATGHTLGDSLGVDKLDDPICFGFGTPTMRWRIAIRCRAPRWFTTATWSCRACVACA